jgi:hypothetical protein
MALPGLSFEIVETSGPVLGIRADRGTLIALTERGPVGVPTLVRSHDEFRREFGCPVDGMLGAHAAALYYANGGEDLIVTRFVPGEAVPALGTMPVVESSSTPEPIHFSARDPGAFGNRIVLQATTTVRHRGKGVLNPGDTVTFTGLSAALFQPPDPATDDPGDEGLPVRVTIAGGEIWTTVDTVSELSSGTQTLTLNESFAGPFPKDAIVQVYDPTFTLRIREPGRADVFVSGLDLRHLEAAKGLLAPTVVTITNTLDAAEAELPVAGVPLKLGKGTGNAGDDGLDPSGSAADLETSFRAAISALEASELPDIVFAPDLWSRIFRTKGVNKLALGAEQAIELGDELVRSAEKLRDRVVLLDPPLVGFDALRPANGEEVVQWRNERAAELVAGRDFSAAYSPWVRIVAGPVFKGDDTLVFPPSAPLAGRIAKTSRERGPWIATGNVPLESVVGLEQALTDEAAEELQDIGLNPLRMSLPRGATIQGVRSLAWPERRAWRFLSVRRLFNYLRRALKPLGLSYTFESNSPATWISMRRDIERLLRDLYAAGALAGATPQEAFFVKIDEALNPEDARQLGVLTAQIGVAPAKPLEFLVVRLIVANSITRVAEEPIIA